ncbi:MAG TPA: hypothetical protein VK038_11025 [Ornithinicoccus sp.]|nr:hypothetical protein [Ornithinicoccus sp.]
MTPQHLTRALEVTSELRTGFAPTAPEPWTPATAAAELNVQLGHLALCLLARHGADTGDLHDPGRPITDVGDELADVLLATLSIPVLAGTQPDPVPTEPAGTGNETIAFLLLLVSAGRLSEAAMRHDHYRHQPTGTPPPIEAASAEVITACEVLAGDLGLDLIAEFDAMAVDAHRFLAGWEAS